MSSALTGGFLTTSTTIPRAHCTGFLSGVSLVQVGNIHRKNYRTSNFRLKNGALSWPRIPGFQNLRDPRLGHPPVWLGPFSSGSTHMDAELPGDSLPAGALGAWVSFTLFSGAQDWEDGATQPFSEAGDGLEMPLVAFRGLEGRAGSCRGRWRSPQWGSSKRTRWNSSSWTLHTVASQCPQPPCKCKSCWRSQPSNLRGIWGRDLCPGETCSDHPPLFCTDCYYPLVSTRVVFLLVILKHQQVSWGHDGDTCPCLPHLPCSHLLFLVFFIITIDIPQESKQRFFWHLEGRDQSGRSKPCQARKATIEGSPGQWRLHRGSSAMWVQTCWLQPQLLLRTFMVTKPGSRVQTCCQELGWS